MSGSAASAALRRLGAELDTLIDEHPQSIVVLDVDGRYTRVNQATCDALGYTPAELFGRSPVEFSSGEHAAAMSGAIERALAGTSSSFSARYKRKDGHLLDIVGRAIPIRVDGEVIGVYGVSRDVTAERNLSLAVGAHADRLRALYAVATSPTTTTDRQILAALRLGAEQLQLDEGFVATLDDGRIAVPHRTLPLAPLDDELIANVASLPGGDVLCVERSGQAYVITPIDVDGERLGALGFRGTGELPAFGAADRDLVRLIGALVASALVRSRAKARLDAVILHDRLTGLPSAVLLDERIERALRAHHRTQKPFAVHLVDIDRFDTVNERFGRIAGDALLRVIAGRLNDAVRETDTVARLGGDAFAVLQIDLVAEGAEDILARRIAERVAEPVLLEGSIVRVSASIGVARCPHDGLDARVLVARADDACRRAKSAGPGTYAVNGGTFGPKS